MATRVEIPEPGIYVHTAANEEYPAGNVVFLNPGWNELDDEMAKNPVVKRLVPEDDAAQQRRFQIYEAQRKRDEAVSQAGVEYTSQAVEVDNQNLEEMRKQEEERAKRVDDDEKRGVARNEPHPDPAVMHAIAITASPGQHMMVSAAGMAGKGDPGIPTPTPAPPTQPDNTLPPEGGARAAAPAPAPSAGPAGAPAGRRTTV